MSLELKEIKEIEKRDSWTLLNYLLIITQSIAINEYKNDFKACYFDKERQKIAKDEIYKRLQDYSESLDWVKEFKGHKGV